MRNYSLKSNTNSYSPTPNLNDLDWIDIYVSVKSGNDTTGDGTINNPYWSVTKSVSVMTEANAYNVYIDPGFYTGDSQLNPPNATEIVFTRYPGTTGGVELDQTEITNTLGNSYSIIFLEIQPNLLYCDSENERQLTPKITFYNSQVTQFTILHGVFELAVVNSSIFYAVGNTTTLTLQNSIIFGITTNLVVFNSVSISNSSLNNGIIVVYAAQQVSIENSQFGNSSVELHDTSNIHIGDSTFSFIDTPSFTFDDHLMTPIALYNSSTTIDSCTFINIRNKINIITCTDSQLQIYSRVPLTATSSELLFSGTLISNYLSQFSVPIMEITDSVLGFLNTQFISCSSNAGLLLSYGSIISAINTQLSLCIFLEYGIYLQSTSYMSLQNVTLDSSSLSSDTLGFFYFVNSDVDINQLSLSSITTNLIFDSKNSVFSLKNSSFYLISNSLLTGLGSAITIENTKVSGSSVGNTILFNQCTGNVSGLQLDLVVNFDTLINVGNSQFNFKDLLINDSGDTAACSITNNLFFINTGVRGGVFQFEQTNFECEISDNTFNSNTADLAGGAIYSKELIIVDKSNKFLGNTATFYGNNIASGKARLGIGMPDDIANDEPITITITMFDYFDNEVTTEAGDLMLWLSAISTPGDFTNVSMPVSLIGGFARVNLNAFVGMQVGSVFNILAHQDGLQSNVELTVGPCRPFQFQSPNNVLCQYCNSTDLVYSPSKQQCVKCNNEKLSQCYRGNVETIENYWMYNNDIEVIKRCEQNLCLGGNQCISGHTGILCGQCLTSPKHNKSSIYCCTLFIIALSLAPTIFNHHVFGSIIIFLQSVAILLYSQMNLYIVPLFRMSLDYIPFICSGLPFNYYTKVAFSFSATIIIIAIGGITSRIAKSLSLVRQIQHPTAQRSPYLSYFWSSTLLFFGPLVFDLFSLSMPCRDIGDKQPYKLRARNQTENIANFFLLIILVISGNAFLDPATRGIVISSITLLFAAVILAISIIQNIRMRLSKLK
ncbi:hypothetical protein PPL_09680 [Heterostelium album PN500]|uniref:Uncharacterized protein n=1 Tax=Heterostelium pallidum (strain ATCC 26659 / Pp 5 / PN500) TaxID=670386 RepID=D3BNH7_HETP5|nr:hypothetical protein PPL_09680 [Heterostelium album PN500]EFA76928.1 hypothetical protein PPL_09680 [Heterostelium album PN500]|eukprot:XP_020429060.1 hypothetical protein PPL_09680 [Heterostelium album PN500]